MTRRRVAGLLRAQGWRVNVKRVHRLWKREGFRVPRRQVKRRRLGSGENGCSRRRAERPRHVWSWDFYHDRTEGGKPLKWFAVVDEFTREWMGECRRVLKPNGVAVVEVGEVEKAGSICYLDEIVAEEAAKVQTAGKCLGVEEVLINQQNFTKLANCFKVENNRKGTNTNRLVVMRCAATRR